MTTITFNDDPKKDDYWQDMKKWLENLPDDIVFEYFESEDSEDENEEE